MDSDLTWDYDAMTLKEQKAFLKELRPYRTLATQDSIYAFLMHVKELWFLHWPLKPARYIDFMGMCHWEGQIWKVNMTSSMLFWLWHDLKGIKNDMMWAGFSSEVTLAHQEHGWRHHLTICEAHQGIYRVCTDLSIASFLDHLHRVITSLPIMLICWTIKWLRR